MLRNDALLHYIIFRWVGLPLQKKSADALFISIRNRYVVGIPTAGRYDPQRQKPLIFWLHDGTRQEFHKISMFIYLYSSPFSVYLCVPLGRLSAPTTGAGYFFPTLTRVISWKRGEERSSLHDINIYLFSGLMFGHVYNHSIFSACSVPFLQNKFTHWGSMWIVDSHRIICKNNI